MLGGEPWKLGAEVVAEGDDTGPDVTRLGPDARPRQRGPLGISVHEQRAGASSGELGGDEGGGRGLSRPALLGDDGNDGHARTLPRNRASRQVREPASLQLCYAASL
jgi:hypothetical protein